MRTLDLFSGLKGWSHAFAERGHDVFTVDNQAKFSPDLVMDVRALQTFMIPWKPDILLASPPCEGFSVMRINRNWTGPRGNPNTQPRTEVARLGLAVALATISFIHRLQPTFFIIENPRGNLRTMSFMKQFERRTVTYCQYGEKRMKPTDLWGGFPPTLELKPPCRNGDDCHMRAPRGSKASTQGMLPELAAKIPHALSLAVCLAMEKSL